MFPSVLRQSVASSEDRLVEDKIKQKHWIHTEISGVPTRSLCWSCSFLAEGDEVVRKATSTQVRVKADRPNHPSRYHVRQWGGGVLHDDTYMTPLADLQSRSA